MLGHGVVCSNEANAFHNAERDGGDAWDHKAPEKSRLPWLEHFYRALDV